MATKIIYTWDNADFTWDNNRFTWDDVVLVREVVEAGASYQEVFKDTKKKEKFIKLICKIEGVEHKETKKIKKRRIRITDVELAAREVLGIDIKVNL